MKKISIDETKLPAVMEIIEKAALLMDEKDCDSDKAVSYTHLHPAFLSPFDSLRCFPAFFLCN